MIKVNKFSLIIILLIMIIVFVCLVLENVNFNNDTKDETINKKVNIITENTVFFDVLKGTSCTQSEYESSYDININDYSNSNTGYNGINGAGNQNSCLKFYYFKKNIDSEMLFLLLDHNTTARVSWNSSANNLNGPKEILIKLKEDTDKWNGTNEPSPHNLNGYTINYTGYKARLISAEEVAEIVGDNLWNELSANYDYTSFISDDYNWLYDRTFQNCEKEGCLNNSNVYTYGYWTSSSAVYDKELAWYVSNKGEIASERIIYVFNGVRPVIEVSKLVFNTL